MEVAKSMAALSPGWEGEVNSGQVPVTALTRRHGYTRGHSMGPDGFRTLFAGRKKLQADKCQLQRVDWSAYPSY
jgi:hypothetical protein